MKSVILFRHAKSDWSKNYSSDHERPINEKGKKAAKKMGLYLSSLNQKPDLIISSTAVRTIQTFKIAMKYGNWRSNIKLDYRMYNSSTEIIFKILQEINNEFFKICLVGHEPTLSTLISNIINGPTKKFSTASMAKINFKNINWKNITYNSANLSWLIRPKEINI